MPFLLPKEALTRAIMGVIAVWRFGVATGLDGPFKTQPYGDEKARHQRYHLSPFFPHTGRV
jgi:hypothetical protein